MLLRADQAMQPLRECVPMVCTPARQAYPTHLFHTHRDRRDNDHDQW